MVEHRVRLGITGLSRSGKTVLLTALVQALLHPERLHGLAAVREGRYRAALLRPQPSQTLPRFPFEENVARLTGTAPDAGGHPTWPESTNRQAELRLSIRYRPPGLLGKLGDEILHLDLFDYPGEWLLDLILLDHDFESWSAAMMEEIAASDLPESKALRARIDAVDPDTPTPGAEATAMELAPLFRAHMHARQEAAGRALALHPGRFLLPGELEGSPILTFAPLPPPGGDTAPRRRRGGTGESPRALMRARFDAYRQEVVRPFHRRHFARLDRQLVLIDALEGLARGGEATARLDRELEALQRALRLGRGWLPRALRPSIDRILFACSKADHLPSDQHPALEDLVRRSLSKSLRHARFGGAETEVLSLAGLRATREVAADGRTARRYLAGRPMDGTEEVAHYPGRIGGGEDDAHRAGAERSFAPLAFQPPGGLDAGAAWPHLRLDRALEFLIGEDLR
nr:YcjX family protein [Marivibrio halodurans]